MDTLQQDISTHGSNSRQMSQGFMIDPASVEPKTVFSAEELDLLRCKFSQFQSGNRNKRYLTDAQAIKLFREDYPTLSEWEIQQVFQKCDLNHDGRLSLEEYLQTRAYHRLLQEENTQNEALRSFTILDTDADGLIIASEALQLIEQSGMSSIGVLKRLILEAANATRRIEKMPSRRPVHPHSREGEITFEHFAATIQVVNRNMQQEIAAKTLRVMELQTKITQISAESNPRSPCKDKSQTLRIEVDVLQKEIYRIKQHLIIDGNSALDHICENLIATYANEQHVYECLSNFIQYCSLHDVTEFRRKLEQSGKQIHVLDSYLLAPPEHVKKTPEYAQMMNLSQTPPLTQSLSSTGTRRVYRTDRQQLQSNSTLRKQFAYYAMAGNVTNFETMTLTNFTKFVKHCELHSLTTPPLTDADIINIFAIANGGSSKAMNFHQWINACGQIFQRAATSNETISDEVLEQLMKRHVIPKAKSIHTQNIAPDLAQQHVMKLLTEHIWHFKQIFSHFGVQSLTEVDDKVTLDMKEFLAFARAFGIICTNGERKGDPCDPPLISTVNPIIQSISLMELIREFYAAKLDISIANPARREAPNLNFHEFLRCLQRIALAMHPHNPKRTEINRGNGIITTSFEAIKEESGRKPERLCTPLYHRRGNLVGASPTNNAKMTSTSMISKLLRASKAAINEQHQSDALLGMQDSHQSLDSVTPQKLAQAPVKIVYGPSHEKPTLHQRPSTTLGPARPNISQRPRLRPVTSGGRPHIRVVRAPNA